VFCLLRISTENAGVTNYGFYLETKPKRQIKSWFLFVAGYFWGVHDPDVCGNLCAVAALLASLLVHEEGPQQQNQHKVSPLSV